MDGSRSGGTRNGEPPWARSVRVRALAITLATLAACGPVSAQDAPTAPSLGGLCRVLSEDLSEGARCRVVARAAGDRVHAAALLASDDRHEELWLAVRGPRAWRVVRAAGTAYSYQDLRGAIALSSLSVRQIVPGGPPEVDAVVRRWQVTLDPPDVCYARRVREVHRYVCSERGGEWSCLGLQVEAAAGETVVLEEPCEPPPWTPPEPWSVALRFTTDELEVTRRAGTPPAVMAPWMRERHPLDEVLRPLGAMPALPSPPDRI